MAAAQIIQGLTAGLSSLGGMATAAVQHKYNKKLADYQNDINIENWNMQNEYNSPKAQRERLEAAGINPAAVFGSNGTSAGNAGQIAQYQQPGVDITQSLLSAGQLAQAAATIRKTNAEAENIENANPYVAAKEQAQINSIISGQKLSDSQAALNEEKRINTVRERDVLIKQLEELDSKIALNAATAGNQSAQKELNNARLLTEYIIQEAERAKTENINAQTIYQKAVNQFIKETGLLPNQGIATTLTDILTTDTPSANRLKAGAVVSALSVVPGLGKGVKYLGRVGAKYFGKAAGKIAARRATKAAGKAAAKSTAARAASLYPEGLAIPRR